jgi:large subunit ribosomal protein L18e
MIKGPERSDIIGAITSLRRAKKAKLFANAADLLSVPRRRRSEVNLSRIARVSKKGDVVVVPGKVLSAGAIEHPVDVVAIAFSAGAKKKISEAGGACRDFSWLISRGAKGIILVK